MSGMNAQKKDAASSCVFAKSVSFPTFLRHPWYAPLVGGSAPNCAVCAETHQLKMTVGIVAVAKLVLLCTILQK